MDETVGAAAVVCAVLALGCAAPVEGELGPEEQILGGRVDRVHHAVGMLVDYANGTLCTATVVGERTVLTAAHCTEDLSLDDAFFVVDGTISDGAVTGTHYGVVSAEELEGLDVGVVGLDGAPDVAPMMVSSVAAREGAAITIVGYGITSTDGEGEGVRRAASNVVRFRGADLLYYRGASGNQCSGDSGGPVLVTRNEREVIVGVVSGHYGDCGGLSFSTRADVALLDAHRAAGGDLRSNLWRNPRNPIDVNNDGAVSPLDALLVINSLRDPLITANGNVAQPVNPLRHFPDVNGDRVVSPLDALLVINEL